MKYFYLNAAAAVVMAASGMAAYAAEPTVETYPLPAGVSSVDPPQGLVDISNNMNPLGVSQVAVKFSGSDVYANPDCEGMIRIYVNGAEEPAEELPATAAYVDNFTPGVGGFDFKHRYLTQGTYRVTIPEGVWKTAPYGSSEGAGTTLSPAIELGYVIATEYTVDPAGGVVYNLDRIVLTAGEGVIAFKYNGGGEIYRDGQMFNYDFTAKEGTDSEGRPTITLTTSLDGKPVMEWEPGVYSFQVPPSTFSIAYTDGPNGEPLFVDCKENLIKYTVSPIQCPDMDPAPGIVGGFSKFEMTVPDAMTSFIVDDMAASYIYPVAGGQLIEDPLYIVKAKRAELTDEEKKAGATESRRVVLSVYDPETNMPVTEEIVPPCGDYALRLTEGVFFGALASTGEMFSCPPFVYNYTVTEEGAVEELPAAVAEDPADIYSIEGIKVGRTADGTMPVGLRPGLYVVAGKKVLVTR